MRVIHWAEPRQASPDWEVEPDAVVWISIPKLDDAWSGSDEDYVGPGGTGAAIDGRYDQFGEWLLSSGKPVEMPMVCLDHRQIGFIDGRHRFAWLRDHGARVMPVQVPLNQADEFTTRFGTLERQSTLQV